MQEGTLEVDAAQRMERSCVPTSTLLPGGLSRRVEGGDCPSPTELLDDGESAAFGGSARAGAAEMNGQF